MYLRKAVVEDEFNEDVWRALINAYCRANRYAEAVLACERHQSILAQEGLACSQSCFQADIQAEARVRIKQRNAIH